MDISIKAQENQVFNYSYGKYLPNGVLALGVIGLGFAIKFGADAFSLNLLWLIPTLFIGIISIAVFIPTELLQIDYDQQLYRVGVKVFSKIYGSWTPIGDVKYLSIIKINKRLALSANTSDPTLKDDGIEECQLRLFIKPGKHILIDDYENKSSAITIARLIAEGMKLKILDATINPPAFI